MKILRQNDSFDVNSGMSLYTIQLEIPPSKRIIKFSCPSTTWRSAKFYLSLPKIGIMASFYKTPDAKIWCYEQFGFFISEDKKTHLIPFPNIHGFEIDSCSSDQYVYEILSVSNKDEYPENICQQFLQTAFNLDSGSNTKWLVNSLVPNEKVKRDCNYYDILLNFYKSWEDKTKTVKNYDFLKDKKLKELLDVPTHTENDDGGIGRHDSYNLYNLYFRRNYQSHYFCAGRNMIKNNNFRNIALRYGYSPDFEFFEQNLAIQNEFFNSQVDNWESQFNQKTV